MRISDWSSDVCSSDLLIALRRSASRLIDTVVAVHCLAHISEVRSASGDRLEADEIGMRDCLAVGHEKGRAVVRKKADALEAFEGVAIEGLRSHFSFLCQSSGMQRLPLDFPLFIRNLLGGEGTTMLYKGGPNNYSKGDWMVIKAIVGIVDVASIVATNADLGSSGPESASTSVAARSEEHTSELQSLLRTS